MTKRVVSVIVTLAVFLSAITFSVSAGMYVSMDDAVWYIGEPQLQGPFVTLEREKILGCEYSDAEIEAYLNYTYKSTRISNSMVIECDFGQGETFAKAVMQIVEKTLNYEVKEFEARNRDIVIVQVEETDLYKTVFRLIQEGYDAKFHLVETPDGSVCYQYGDLDLNGKVESKDCMMLKRIVLETYSADANQTLLADINEDGRIDAQDYMMAKRHVLGTYQIIYGKLIYS